MSEVAAPQAMIVSYIGFASKQGLLHFVEKNKGHRQQLQSLMIQCQTCWKIDIIYWDI